jgi:hypothetical protein
VALGTMKKKRKKGKKQMPQDKGKEDEHYLEDG